MSGIEVRPLGPADMPAASALLDAALGTGFWTLDLDAPGSHLVAVAEGEIVGVSSAIMADVLGEAPGLEGPVGLIRLVAVRPDARGKGLGRRLVSAAEEGCVRLGAASLAAFAWVYGSSGDCPLAGILERLGFLRMERLAGFYASVTSGADGRVCPQCRSEPCVCAADLYVKLLSTPQEASRS